MTDKTYELSLSWDTVSSNIGNLGIGIDNPQKTLDVFGDLKVTNNLYQAYQQTGYWKDVAGDSNIVYTNGNVGINTSAPGFPVDVAGTVKATDFLYTSDESAKTHIADEYLGLAFINALQPKSFRYNAAPTLKKHGFIAQELPVSDFTNTDTEGYYSLMQLDMLAPIIKSLQTLSEKQNYNLEKALQLQKYVNAI